MAGKLFCQLCPLTYQLSTWRMQGNRWLSDRTAALTGRLRLANHRAEPLPVVVYAHRSLILRTLGGADPVLQQHKKVNLTLSAPKVDGILIRPGETFSVMPFSDGVVVEYLTGAEYPLQGGVPLPMDRTLGVSNVLAGVCARLRLRSGWALVFTGVRA